MLNNVQLQGRLTKDPTVTTPGNSTKVFFTLAVGDDYVKDKAHFVRCGAWNKTGEFIAKHFHKGDMMLIAGNLRSYKPNDSAYEQLEVNVTNVYFAGAKKEAAAEEPVEDFNQVGDLPF